MCWNFIGDFYLESFHGNNSHYQGNISINNNAEFSQNLNLPHKMLGTYEEIEGSFTQENDNYFLSINLKDRVVSPGNPIRFESNAKLYLDIVENNNNTFTFSGTDANNHKFKLVLNRLNTL